VKYHNHALFLGYFDHSHAIRVTVNKRFDGKRVQRVRKAFKSCCSRDNAKSRPLFFTCFGTVDELAVAVVEQPAKFTQAAAAAPELANFTLGLAPDLTDTSQKGGPIQSPEEFFRLDNFEEAPLIVTCNLKLNGVLRLAYGTFLQSATWECLCREIELFLSLSDDSAPIFSTEDRSKVRCCLLDAMSSDDIVLVVRTPNYSLAANLIARMRNFTLSTLTKGSGIYIDRLKAEMKKCVSADSSTKEYLTPYMELGKILSFEDESKVWQKDTCLFASSYSTFGFSSHLASEKLLKSTSGQVGVRLTCDVRPGMDAKGRRLVNRLFADISSSPPFEKCQHLLAGKHDLSLTVNESKLVSDFQFLDSGKLCATFSRFFSGSEDETKLQDSGLYDIVTDLVVPHREPARVEESCANYAVSLRRIAEGLRVSFLESNGTVPVEVTDVLELSPSTVGRFQRLYSEFTVAIENPLLFDSAIDLTDAFYSLHKAVVEFAPKEIESASVNARAGFRSVIRAYIVEALEALKRSFYLRMERASAKRDEKNLRVEVKGSLNNLIACADVSLKVCLGLFRFSVSPDPELFEKHDYKRLFGGVVAAELNRRTRAKWLTFENDQFSTTFLVEMDIAHLFQPELFTRIFHEAGHLLFTSCFGDNPAYFYANFNPYSNYAFQPSKDRLLSSLASESLEEIEGNSITWIQEIFSELFIFATVFEGAGEKYILHYFKDLIAIRHELDIPDQSWKSKISTVDFLFRAFVVSLLGEEYETGEVSSTPMEDTQFASKFRVFLQKHYESIPMLDHHLFSDLADDTSNLSEYCSLRARIQFNRFAMARASLIPRLRQILGDYRSHRTKRYRLPPNNGEILRREVERSYKSKDVSVGVEAMNDEFAFVAEMLRQLAPESHEELVEPKIDVQAFCWSTKLLWHVSTRQRFRRLVSLLSNEEEVVAQ
jgi:hypothetical protein